jgi:hypothetical protein
MNIAVLGDHVAQVDADPKYDPLILGDAGIAFGHAVLDGNSAGDGLDDAREFDQEAVSGRFDNAAFVLVDFWIDQFASMGAEPREGAGFVLAHEAAVTGDIGGENGRKTPLYPLPAQRALREVFPSMEVVCAPDAR